MGLTNLIHINREMFCMRIINLKTKGFVVDP